MHTRMAQLEFDNKLNLVLGRCNPASRDKAEGNRIGVASRDFEQFFWRLDL